MQYLGLLIGGLLVFSGHAVARNPLASRDGFITSRIQDSPFSDDFPIEPSLIVKRDASSSAGSTSRDPSTQTTHTPEATNKTLNDKAKARACSATSSKPKGTTTQSTSDGPAEASACPTDKTKQDKTPGCGVNKDAQIMCDAIHKSNDPKVLKDAIKKTKFSERSASLFNMAGEKDASGKESMPPYTKVMWDWLLDQTFKGAAVPEKVECTLEGGCQVPSQITHEFCLDAGNPTSNRWIFIPYLYSFENYANWVNSFMESIMNGAETANENVDEIIRKLDPTASELADEAKHIMHDISKSMTFTAVADMLAGVFESFVPELQALGNGLTQTLTALDEYKVMQEEDQEIENIVHTDTKIADDEAFLSSTVSVMRDKMQNKAAHPFTDIPKTSKEHPYTKSSMNIHSLFGQGQFIAEPAETDITKTGDHIEVALKAFVGANAWSDKIVFVVLTGDVEVIEGETKKTKKACDLDLKDSEFHSFCSKDGKTLYASFWANTKITRNNAQYGKTPNVDKFESATGLKLEDAIPEAVRLYHKVGYNFDKSSAKTVIGGPFGGDSGASNTNNFFVPIPVCDATALWKYRPNWHVSGYDDIKDVDYFRTVVQLCDMVKGKGGTWFPFFYQHTEGDRRNMTDSAIPISYNGPVNRYSHL